MKIIKDMNNGVVVLEQPVFGDDRGFFSARVLNSGTFNMNVVQESISFSKKGTIRGLHFQRDEHTQGKLIRCLSGKIIDIVVDLRPDSDTMGNAYWIELKGFLQGDYRSFWCPRGFAHGFVALEDSYFQYLVDNDYNKDSESGYQFSDTLINKLNLGDLNIIKSDKDSKWNEIMFRDIINVGG